MSAFNGLKLVAAKRPQAATPIVQRRNKLSNQLWEQIELARAAAEGRTFAPIKLRNVINKVTGERTRIEAAKRVKQWWFVADTGRVCASEIWHTCFGHCITAAFQCRTCSS